MWILLAIVAIFLVREAIQEYSAEKYANKKLYNKDVNFFAYMFENHFVMMILAILFIVLLIAALFST